MPGYFRSVFYTISNTASYVNLMLKKLIQVSKQINFN
jgi:hypothetical protein